MKIRAYDESRDAEGVGILIADTFGKFNLSYATPEEQHLLLGPFRHARSPDPAHRAAIVEILRADMIFIAEEEGEIVGVLRGKVGRLHSLFVDERFHRRGIGRRLVEHFERECLHQGAGEITLDSSLYAVDFYIRLGYEKAGEIESGPCFDGDDFPCQPMRKALT